MHTFLNDLYPPLATASVAGLLWAMRQFAKSVRAYTAATKANTTAITDLTGEIREFVPSTQQQLAEHERRLNTLEASR